MGGSRGGQAPPLKNRVSHQLKKSCQSWTSFWIRACSWAIMFYVMRQCTTCYPTLKTARGMKAADLIFMSAADIISRQVWPRPGPTKCFNFCFHNKGADKNVRYPGWSATLLVSYNKVGVKHLQTCGKDFCKFWYVCHRGWSQGLLLFSLRWML